ncbi:MAG: exonuclease SbcCD subunit D [Actinomycetales bacterium]
MRLLHTSDWHLGRSFHREDLLTAQSGFVDQLVEVVRAEGVDVVLVAGDIYDRALPSVDAVGLADEALCRLAATGARTVVTSGNHDSARRLGFSSRLIDAAGVHLRTAVPDLHRPVELEDEHGSVLVYGLPYLEPALVADALVAERSHASVTAAALARVRADWDRRGAQRAVVMAHTFVTGGEPCESERDIRVGGVDSVPLSLFDGFTYTALGHLHGQQTLAPAVRYSGSPLPYSFSEEHHPKGMWLLDLDRDGVASAERVPVEAPRPLARLRGDLDQLLGGREWEPYTDHYLAITLTDAVRPREPMERLRRRFPHVLQLSFEPVGAVPSPAGSYRSRLQGLDELDTCCSFLEHVRGAAADDVERELLASALDGARLRQVEI